jgi:hypothetical protein
MQQAAINLKAGAFKLWIYFAKNQDGYEFALSSKSVADEFGIKIDQYNSAIKELMEKGYLIQESGNRYSFNEIPVIGKTHNAVNGKPNNAVNGKPNNAL